MRGSGLMHPTDLVPVPADTIQTIATTTAAQAFDMPTNAQMMLIQSAVGIYFNGVSTFAASNSSGTTSSSMQNEFMCPNLLQWRQIVGGSTGYSVQSSSAGGGPMSISFFRKN